MPNPTKDTSTSKSSPRSEVRYEENFSYTDRNREQHTTGVLFVAPTSDLLNQKTLVFREMTFNKATRASTDGGYIYWLSTSEDVAVSDISF